MAGNYNFYLIIFKVIRYFIYLLYNLLFYGGFTRNDIFINNLNGILF